mmetsp:Transcript_13165/g.29997  ORF Transcript_13165/g.29997 Transcript_13165/m.29997 type:complete len:218 (-) Transcript_13165:147-800(-)
METSSCSCTMKACIFVGGEKGDKSSKRIRSRCDRDVAPDTAKRESQSSKTLLRWLLVATTSTFLSPGLLLGSCESHGRASGHFPPIAVYTRPSGNAMVATLSSSELTAKKPAKTVKPATWVLMTSTATRAKAKETAVKDATPANKLANHVTPESTMATTGANNNKSGLKPPPGLSFSEALRAMFERTRSCMLCPASLLTTALHLLRGNSVCAPLHPA